MDESGIKIWIFIAIVLSIGLGILPNCVFKWYIKNVMTPQIGLTEQIASISSLPDPWIQLQSLISILVVALITKALLKCIKEKVIKEVKI